MASSKETFQDIINSELTCPLCLSRFQTPKDLDCQHVYCQSCLEMAHRAKRGGPILTCPECRQLTKLPKNGIRGLKTNLRLRNMVEAVEKQGKQEVTEEKKKIASIVPECGQHEGEKLHLYCETDDYLVCHVCAVVDHPYPEHKCRNVKEVVEEQKDRDTGILCKASLKIDELSQEVLDLSRAERSVTEFMAAEEVEILRCIRSIQKAVSQRGAAMINMMKQMHEDHITDLRDAQENIIDMTNQLNSACEAVRTNMNDSTNYEYVAQHKSLYDNMSILVQQKVMKADVDKNFPRIKFVPNKIGQEELVNLGHLRTSTLHDVGAQIYSHLPFPSAVKKNKTDKVEDIAELSDGSLVMAFESKICVFKEELKDDEEEQDGTEYKLQLCVEPPVGFQDKPCWVGATPSDEAVGVWLPRGVAVADNRFAIIDRSPYVKIYSTLGKFQSMFTTMNDVTSNEDTASSATPEQVNYLCITQDTDGKRLFLGDYNRKVITTHELTGKTLNTFPLQDGPYKINVFGQRIAVTTIEDRIDLMDKITGDIIQSIDVDFASGACVDIKSGCMFVTTTDPDSYEYENGTMEAYCSMTGKHIRCLVPMLYEPCGAMVYTLDDRLAVVDREGVNIYNITYMYE